MTSIYHSNAILEATERPRLLHDFLLVEREGRDKFAGGLLYLPDVIHEADVWVGVVVGIGDGPKTKKGVRLPTNVKLGDRVAFNAVASWTTLVVGHVKYTMVRELDLLGILEPDVQFEIGVVRANMKEAQ